MFERLNFMAPSVIIPIDCSLYRKHILSDKNNHKGQQIAITQIMTYNTTSCMVWLLLTANTERPEFGEWGREGGWGTLSCTTQLLYGC